LYHTPTSRRKIIIDVRFGSVRIVVVAAVVVDDVENEEEGMMVKDYIDLVVVVVVVDALALTPGDLINQLPHRVLVIAVVITAASIYYIYYHCYYNNCCYVLALRTYRVVKVLVSLLRQRQMIYLIDTHVLRNVSLHNTCTESYIDGHA
jgi:hypothetical protein